MQDKVGSGDFVERRLEGLDQGGGQLLDEADGVGDGDLAALGQFELAGGGVQRGEELVVAEHVGSGEPVDERAFPGIGITGQCHFEHAAAVPALTLQRAHVGQALKLAANARDALAHHAAVHLQLAFALTEAGSHAASHAVRSEVGPHAAQARVQVLVLGEAHLQAPLLGGGVQGEDVQNEGRTVDDLHGLVHDLLQIGLLGRCQLIVEDDEVGLARPCQLGDFVGLARADEGARVGRVQALGRRGHHIGSGRIGQTFQLGQGRFQGPRQPRALDAHENGALAALLGLGGRTLLDDGFVFGHSMLLCFK